MSTDACTDGNCGGGCSFHDDKDGTGAPVVDVRRFPDMPGLVKFGHGLGLRVGSYLNNCICAEGGKSPTHYAEDVAWLVGLGFDGVKVACHSLTQLTPPRCLLSIHTAWQTKSTTLPMPVSRSTTAEAATT
eukprot:SAG22_NODE_983_length_6163_cov_8.370053_3_plen_131_part_00